MAIPLNLRDIQSGFLTAAGHNENNSLLSAAFEKAINREGGSNNQMLADLDMGLNKISNLLPAFLNHQAVPLKQLQDIIAASSDDLVSLLEFEDRVFAEEGQQEIELQSISYIPSTYSLMVYLDGEYQRAGWEFLEPSRDKIFFVKPLSAGQTVDIFGHRYDAKRFVELASAEADRASAEANRSESEANRSRDEANRAESEADRAASEADRAGQAADDSVQRAKDEADRSEAEADRSRDEADRAEAEADRAYNASGYKLDVNNQAGVTYTLVREDEGDFVRMDNPNNNTIIVPPFASVDFELGTIVLVRQKGLGTTTVQGGFGVTLNAPFNDYSISEKDFGVALIKVDTDEWDVIKAFGGVDTSDLVAFSQEFDERLDELFREILSANPTFVVNFDSLRTELNRQIAEMAGDFTELYNNTQQITEDIQSSFDQFGEDFSTLQDNFNGLSNSFSDLEQDFTGLQSNFGALQTNFQDLDNSFSTLQGNFETLEQSFEELELTFAGFVSRVDGVEQDFVALQGNFNSLVNSFTQLQDNFNQISIDFESMEGRFDTIEQRFDTFEQTLDDLNLADGSFDGLLQRDGYQKLPSGLIIQWGYLSGLPSGQPSSPRVVRFPVSFPNACLNVSFTYGSRTDKDGDSAWVRNFTPISFTWQQMGYSGNEGYWFAIGH